MKTQLIAVIAGAVAAASLAGAAQAHHSFAATYHIDDRVTVKGTVVQFLFRNPHSFIHVMAPDPKGKMQRYAIEWGGGAALGREVNSTSLKPGDKVEIIGNPGRVEADHRMRLQKITRPSDGWTWGGNFD